MGRCITVITLSGAASLGLLTGSMTYQTLQGIPDLIRKLSQQSDATVQSSAVVDAIKKNMTWANIVNLALAAMSTGLFTTAYKYSPAAGKHPYLIYSALAAPLSLVALYVKGGKQSCVLSQWVAQLYRKTEKKVEKAEKAEKKAAPPSRESSVESEGMGSSYIHVSDSSSVSSESAPGSPVSDDAVQPVASAIEQEVENALLKKERLHGLESVQSAYKISAAVSSVGLAICTIGIVGDRYFL